MITLRQNIRYPKQKIEATAALSVFSDFPCSVGLNQMFYLTWLTYLTGNWVEGFLDSLILQVLKAGIYLSFTNFPCIEK